MAQFDRFLIAPLNSGLQTNLRAWQIMDDAFAKLQNAWVFRGRVKKRFGSDWMEPSQANTRLRISLGNNTNAAMNLPTGGLLAIGQTFSLGSDFFNVYQLGAGVATLSTNGAVTCQIDSTVTPNTVTFTGGAASPVFWYPSLPVMGITQYESNSINNHPSYAFDTRFAYLYTAGSGWTRSGTALWNGNDLNFFWATNWQGSASSANTGTPVMFVTNFNASIGAGKPAATDDPIWFTADGATWTAMLGSTVNGIFFLPNGGARTAARFVQTALIIVPFKDRLLLLNTIENDNSGGAGSGTATQFKNRCRYSFNGSPLALNAWYEPNQVDAAGNKAAGAGFIDAPTEEAIVSAEFIKDRLIVYFERSTWELAYTANEVLPFVWQKLNTELGSQSTFSTVPFDREVLTIGNTGVHSCNGSNVERIDQKIPQQIFNFFSAQNSSPARTAGIRDYFVEGVYWTYVKPSQNLTTQKFPSQVLVYNYQNQSWAVNDDCFTAFGYLEQSTDMTWASSDPILWEEAEFIWTSNIIDADHRQILAGTPEGYVLIINEDMGRNAPAMQITTITNPGTGFITFKVINHNLAVDDWIAIEFCVGTVQNQTIYQVYSVTDADTFVIYSVNDFVGSYIGGGTVARVSQIQINTKQWNPYDKQGKNVYLSKIDFFVERTVNGAITVDYWPSSSQISMVQDSIANGTNLGTNVLETSPYGAAYAPLELYQDRLVHPIYFQVVGECIQLNMYFSSTQMLDTAIVWEDFELDGLILYTQQVGRLQ